MEKVSTKKLKTISHSKLLLLGIIFLTIINMLITFLHPQNSNLSLDTKSVIGKVIEYTKNDKEINLKVKLKNETLLAYVKKSSNDQEIRVGMEIKLWGELELPPKNTIPNTFSYREYLKTENIFYQMQVTKWEVVKEPSITNRWKEFLRERCNQIENSSYLKKIILGIKEEENKEAEESYRQNGISHIFAISGMHLGVIYSFFTRHGKGKKKNILFAYLMVAIYYSWIVVSASSKR
ncbi:MAG: ComEC family competence protein, partial [Bacilli bacterium]|nr:ComEC family competence protein [Bacilli bacterium]